ncbi:MAG: HepT-like ribonuclease domain-containing protein [Nitrospirota bacterium]
MSRDWSLYLDDILTCCSKIRTYTAGMARDQFTADEKTYDAVVRNLEIIGEAAKNIPPSIQALMPEVDWRKPAGLRDIIAHAYFGIDDAILWDVILNKVPELQQAIEQFNQRKKQ